MMKSWSQFMKSGKCDWPAYQKSGKRMEIHPVSWKLEKQNEIDKNREKYFEKHVRPYLAQ